jgi:hypothetical protein
LPAISLATVPVTPVTCVKFNFKFANPTKSYEVHKTNKMISHLLLTVLTNFSRNVTLNVFSRATVGYLLFFALEQLGGSLQRRKMRIYDS